MRVPDEFLEEAVLRLTHECGTGESICPSEAARAVAARTGGMWKAYLPDVRKAAVSLAKKNLVAILRDGKRVDPDTFRGLYRIGMYDPALEEYTPEPASVPVTTAIIAAAQPPAFDAAPEPEHLPAMRHGDARSPARDEADVAASLQITAALNIVLTLEDLAGDADETDYVDLPPLVLDEEDPPAAVEEAPVPGGEEDDDPDLYRAPQAATLDDIARGLERYLTPELDDVSVRDTAGHDLAGLPDEADEKPVPANWHDAFRRYLETPAPDEE